MFLDPTPVEEAYLSVGAPFDLEVFHQAERTARAELTARVTDGHDGTEATLWRVYFQRILELTGVPARLTEPVGAAMRQTHERNHLWTFTPDTVQEALGRLRAADLRLGVVSNADGRMEGAIRAAGIREHFEFVIDSGDVGVAKPDPEIFHMASRSLALPPNRCLYVGDLYPVDVVGAERAGMQALLLDPDNSARSLPVRRINSVADLPGLLLEETESVVLGGAKRGTRRVIRRIEKA